MNHGANYVHRELREELERYIRSQYFGRSQLLLSAIGPHLDDEGLLYQKPYIESSPAYQTLPNGFTKSKRLPQWLRQFFSMLSEVGLGVYPTPYLHQMEALEAAFEGQDVFVSTGTGSGKTECFLWPLLAKLVTEAYLSPGTWERRGVRAVLLYPMNALVSDQLSRLRRLIGDPEGRFLRLFRKTCGASVRRPQFGMYTGRTPYPGPKPESKNDHELEKTLRRMTCSASDSERDFFEKLLQEGKLPAKTNMPDFLEGIHHGKHIPDAEDAELITRFEMQAFCPDILITNYSMLELMLLRPREQNIWEDTRAWLASDTHNKLMVIVDEAHMYKGASGGEVAFLLRRLFHKLEITRSRVQFILTTASMPDQCPEDRAAVQRFARDLTSANSDTIFCFLTGKRDQLPETPGILIPTERFLECDLEAFEQEDASRIRALQTFWSGVPGCPGTFQNTAEAGAWMYEHLTDYQPFRMLLQQCRGTAVSLRELAEHIFPDMGEEEGLRAVSVMLEIAPLARNEKGTVLFPARMHMLFKGLRGVYACANAQCPHAHSDSGLTLGEVFFDASSGGLLSCPHCGSTVYELYNDRRCGALFFKGYLLLKKGRPFPANAYLWRNPGYLLDSEHECIKEIHLFLPTANDGPFKGTGTAAVKPCYLDVKSGFVFFSDDSQSGKPDIRKLYYSTYSAKGRPQVLTFYDCPHCGKRLSGMQLTSFSTKGNEPFFSLIQTQFQLQPPVEGKTGDPVRMPNEGRKILLFSDSRQRAARLARDISDATDSVAARQLYALSVQQMQASPEELSLDALYGFFCLAAGQNNAAIFQDDKEAFTGHIQKVLREFERSRRRNKPYSPNLTVSKNAVQKMKIALLRFFCGAYNTLYDTAISWLEPMEKAMDNTLDILQDEGIQISEQEFMEFFHAWLISIFDRGVALGNTIDDNCRKEVRKQFDPYGLSQSEIISDKLLRLLGIIPGSREAHIWSQAMQDGFLDMVEESGRYYLDLSHVKPRMDLSRIWYRCERCSELTPFLLRGGCPSCGFPTLHPLTGEEHASLQFWREPVERALRGEKLHVIDTEEHTAQISHKDQRDSYWSRTEQYELRFQDLLQEHERPVDILSSTTTMEVGIDIGSLVAIGLRNIPPMRENYQQRAGRAGRRGASLSTIITFCEDGPHDMLYFKNPVPMLRGDARRPWVDIISEKLRRRHLTTILFQMFLSAHGESLDALPAAKFLDERISEFLDFVNRRPLPDASILLPENSSIDWTSLSQELARTLFSLHEKRLAHPDLFGVREDEILKGAKSLLDALYEVGGIPTFSFPKDVISMWISDPEGRVLYQVERGLDIAISEYAPGRSLVVDKKTYQIGGLYSYGSEFRKGQVKSPARSYIEDGNYRKGVLYCPSCNWFGLEEDAPEKCPFCGHRELEKMLDMLRPWGMAPRNAEEIPEAQLSEEYTFTDEPLYSTLPEADEMRTLRGLRNIRFSARMNQRIILLNRGQFERGFTICKDCGAAMPGDGRDVLKGNMRPYRTKYAKRECPHTDVANVNLGYDFVTDMMVLEFRMDPEKVNIRDHFWLTHAAVSLAEALRIVASRELDVEFTELVSGHRIRNHGEYVDIYLYDSLSSGAGYAVRAAEMIPALLEKARDLLRECHCESACYRCLKHYRNQRQHGNLDRTAALELLEWGVNGALANPIPLEQQKKALLGLEHILDTIIGISVHMKNHKKYRK